MTWTVARCSALLRGFFALILFVLLSSLLLAGCAGGKKTTASVAGSVEAPADSLKAKFSITIYSEDGSSQDLDAVLFSVPNKRYRMELTAMMGVGVASLLWLESGWQMVFPTERMYVTGAGYMVGLFTDPSIPMVHIHQVAGLFDGKVLPEKLEEVSTRDSVANDSAVVKIREARDPFTRRYTYAEKNGEVLWLETLGRDGKDEKLVIEEYKVFSGVKTPSKISFIRDGATFLEIRVKKVYRDKSFSSGTWRLNIPKSYKAVGE